MNYQVVQLDSKTLGICMQWLTGHTRMNRHQHLVDKGAKKYNVDDDGDEEQITAPTCRLCHRGDETPYHLVMDCDEMCDDSNISFGRQQMPPDLEKFQFNCRVHKLEGFLMIPDLGPLLGLEEPEDENQQDEENDVMDVDQNNDATANQRHDRSMEEIYDVPLHPSEY